MNEVIDFPDPTVIITYFIYSILFAMGLIILIFLFIEIANAIKNREKPLKWKYSTKNIPHYEDLYIKLLIDGIFFYDWGYYDPKENCIMDTRDRKLCKLDEIYAWTSLLYIEKAIKK